jgi:hypothetical protein
MKNKSYIIFPYKVTALSTADFEVLGSSGLSLVVLSLLDGCLFFRNTTGKE